MTFDTLHHTEHGILVAGLEDANTWFLFRDNLPTVKIERAWNANRSEFALRTTVKLNTEARRTVKDLIMKEEENFLL